MVHDVGNSQTYNQGPFQVQYIVARFLALVTTMVTMVDHGNHRSNDRGNDRSNHLGYYDSYYNVNA